MAKKYTIIAAISIAIISGAYFIISGYFFNSEKKEFKIKLDEEKSSEIKSDVVKEDGVAKSENTVNQQKDEQSEPAFQEPPSKNNGTIKIVDRFVNFGYQKSSSRAIDTIIVHSSYNALGGDRFDLDKIIEEYKAYEVSPHYIIDRGGNIYRLVADKDIAYHAGQSATPDGRKNVNNFSLGIEMVNAKDSELTDKQYSALSKLIQYLKERYEIRYVLGHDQVAPGRKDDPWNLDWALVKGK